MKGAVLIDKLVDEQECQLIYLTNQWSSKITAARKGSITTKTRILTQKSSRSRMSSKSCSSLYGLALFKTCLLFSLSCLSAFYLWDLYSGTLGTATMDLYSGTATMDLYSGTATMDWTRFRDYASQHTQTKSFRGHVSLELEFLHKLKVLIMSGFSPKISVDNSSEQEI